MQVVDVMEFMSDVILIFILLDVDIGYGNFNNVCRLVWKLEDRGVVGKNNKYIVYIILLCKLRKKNFVLVEYMQFYCSFLFLFENVRGIKNEVFFFIYLLLGVCLEDKLFFKINLLYDGWVQLLVDIEEFVLKIKVFFDLKKLFFF